MAGTDGQVLLLRRSLSMNIDELIRRLIQRKADYLDGSRINVVLTDSDGGLISIISVSGVDSDPNGDLYVSLETDEVII